MPFIVLLIVPFFLWACPMEERLIFHPDNTVSQTPRDAGLKFDDVYFTASDGVRLNGWFVPYPNARRTLVWFHGNAGNISHRIHNLKLLHDKVKINVFIFDYRGYGRSGGKLSESGTYLDGAAAIELLGNRYNVEMQQLILFGRSLGAAVAVEMATRNKSLVLILESPFSSVPEMARTVFPLFPLGPLLRTQYNNLDKVRRIKSPLLVLHGDQDEIIPFSHGQKVFEAAPEPKKFHAIVGAGHNDTYLVGGEVYFITLRETFEWAASFHISAQESRVPIASWKP